jgi:hypothetical protein
MTWYDMVLYDISYNRPGGAKSVVAMGDAIILVKDVKAEPEVRTLKLINPDSGQFQGEVCSIGVLTCGMMHDNI